MYDDYDVHFTNHSWNFLLFLSISKIFFYSYVTFFKILTPQYVCYLIFNFLCHSIFFFFLSTPQQNVLTITARFFLFLLHNKIFFSILTPMIIFFSIFTPQHDFFFYSYPTARYFPFIPIPQQEFQFHQPNVDLPTVFRKLKILHECPLQSGESHTNLSSEPVMNALSGPRTLSTS